MTEVTRFLEIEHTCKHISLKYKKVFAFILVLIFHRKTRSSKGLRKRFILARGAYVTHGETFVHPQDEIWWAKGGRLYGESAKRIAFLRELIEAAPAACRPIPEVRDVPAFGVPGQYYLHYYGIHQPLYRIVDLPEGETFRAEIIDTWNMEITPIEQPMSGTCRVDMPGKPYIALRIERI